MTYLPEVTTNIRSKNAGPFSVTFDIFFDSDEAFTRYSDDPGLQPLALSKMFNVPSQLISRYALPSLNVVKFSIPRRAPQGGPLERDMHCGQLYVALLKLKLKD